MKQKCNPFLIGIFTFSAIILLCLSCIAVLGGKIWQEHTSFILFFNSSLNGLDVGSPVKFNGVNIGTVKEVNVVFDESIQQAFTPVIIDIDDKVFYQFLQYQKKKSKTAFYRQQILGGLAAKLVLESLITGKLFIELDYYPANQVRIYNENHTKLTQIPSIASDRQNFLARIDTILTNVSSINFKSISDSLSSILQHIDSQVKKSDIASLINNISSAADSISTFISSEELRMTVHSVQSLASKIKDFLGDTSSTISDLQRNINLLIANFNSALNKLGNTCDYISDLTNPHSETRVAIHKFIIQLNKTINQIQLFLDLLHRHPNALVTGIDYEHKE